LTSNARNGLSLGDAARARGFPSLRQVSGVVNDELSAAEVRLNVGADLHLEVVEALMKPLVEQSKTRGELVLGMRQAFAEV